ncbi:hypothetical protein E4V42_07285 [Clostridium estertheticum]|uniref:hypothetical protein n=1 Tax=Clostridium estertheticum TaxID=238834 RepID=UPI00128513C0|nr:hypothetical protein [Clostridium estertheticum]MPQ31239.1 hypothetical protein [Clostridium estertheticum]
MMMGKFVNLTNKIQLVKDDITKLNVIEEVTKKVSIITVISYMYLSDKVETCLCVIRSQANVR